VSPCPCPDILEVEVEKVVPFDHVRVKPGDLSPRATSISFSSIPFRKHFGIALIIHQRNGKDPVLLPLGVGEFKSRAQAVSISRASR